MSGAARPVSVEVGSLVLVGVPPRHGTRVAEAFSAELSRLLVERPPQLGPDGFVEPVERVDGGEVHVGGGGRRAEALGRAAARAVHGGLER